MKKHLLLSASAALILFASCDSNDGKIEQTFGVPCLSLVTDMNANATDAYLISPTTYTFNINYTDNLMTVSGSGLNLGSDKLSFVLENTPYKYTDFAYTVSASSVPAISGGEVKSLRARITEISLAPPANVSGDLPFTRTPSAIISYTWNNLMVRTFPADAVYTGYTSTAVDGSSEFTTDTPIYRFRINASDKTATLIIYNGKFSDNPKMPALNLRLDGLKVIPGAVGYTIVGENVVPATLGEGTPYPDFTFSEINFSTVSEDLTSCRLTFTIPSKRVGNLTGSFQGSYLLDPKSLQ